MRYKLEQLFAAQPLDFLLSLQEHRLGSEYSVLPNRVQIFPSNLRFEECQLTAERFTDKLSTRYLHRCAFADSSILKDVLSLSTWRLRHRAQKCANQWISALYEVAWREPFMRKLSIRPSHPLVGLGLFTDMNIPAHQFIGEYTGVVRKRHKRRDRGNPYIFGYDICSYSTPYIIDAREEGNYTKFINHSAQPNLFTRTMIIAGVPHIFFYTRRPITANEELTFDYGPGFWKRREYPVTL